MINIITYNLKAKERDYSQLYAGIKSISKRWWRFVDSVWIIDTDRRPTSIKQILLPYIHSKDELFVGLIEDCSGYLPIESINWLENDLNDVESKEFTFKCRPDK